MRVYKEKDVPRDELNEIAQCCGYCPTGAHGGEGWERNVTIVTGKENMQHVLEYTIEYMKILKKMLNGFIVKLVSRWVPEARGGLSTLPDLLLRLELYDKGQAKIIDLKQFREPIFLDLRNFLSFYVGKDFPSYTLTSIQEVFHD